MSIKFYISQKIFIPQNKFLATPLKQHKMEAFSDAALCRLALYITLYLRAVSGLPVQLCNIRIPAAAADADAAAANTGERCTAYTSSQNTCRLFICNRPPNTLHWRRQKIIQDSKLGDGQQMGGEAMQRSR